MRRNQQEVDELTDRIDSDRLLLEELIIEKGQLESEERITTERVCQTRRAIQNKKAAVEALEQQRDGLDRENAVLVEEKRQLRAEVGQYIWRRA